MKYKWHRLENGALTWRHVKVLIILHSSSRAVSSTTLVKWASLCMQAQNGNHKLHLHTPKLGERNFPHENKSTADLDISNIITSIHVLKIGLISTHIRNLQITATSSLCNLFNGFRERLYVLLVISK